MPTALQTPFDRFGQAEQVGRRLWRKQVLPRGQKIIYRKDGVEREVSFDDRLLRTAVESFNAASHDQVPFLLDPGGTDPHDKAGPRDFTGEVAGLELAADGLYALIDPTEDGEKVLRKNQKLGVSARIVEDYDRADGAHFDTAIAHVLGTLDPRLTGLKPWEPVVNLANGEDMVVVDLTAARYEGEPNVPDPKPEDKGGDPKAYEKITDAHLAALDALPGVVERLESLTSGAPVVDDEDLDLEDLDDLDALTDEEREYLRSEGLLDDDEDVDAGGRQPEPVALSADAQRQLDLINSERAAQDERIRTLELERSAARWEKEAMDWANAGVPPKVIELAKPLVMGGEHTIDLANGESWSPAQQVRDLLAELKGTVDLSGPSHALAPPTSASSADEDRAYKGLAALGNAGYDRKALDVLAAQAGSQ